MCSSWSDQSRVLRIARMAPSSSSSMCVCLCGLVWTRVLSPAAWRHGPQDDPDFPGCDSCLHHHRSGHWSAEAPPPAVTGRGLGGGHGGSARGPAAGSETEQRPHAGVGLRFSCTMSGTLMSRGAGGFLWTPWLNMYVVYFLGYCEEYFFPVCVIQMTWPFKGMLMKVLFYIKYITILNE